MKELIAVTIISCTGFGAVLGGTINAIDSMNYRNALEDPGFYHLVDEAGDPVSQEIK